jgi:SAM-dependent methyltransferase
VGVRRPLVCGALTLILLAALSAQTVPPAKYLSHAQAGPVYAALEVPVPTAGAWPGAIAAADADTRARVARGDEGSIVNLLLFGTSFTSQPRITSRQLSEGRIRDALNERLRDFERALAQPEANPRFQFARRVLPDGPAARPRLLAMIDRAVQEEALHARLMADAHALGDPSLEFAERSRLYRERGLASDTSVRVNFAIEEALRRLYAARPEAGSVRRVAVIGPGLDVVDKQEGYDFYPPQTIQPFALIDSLTRLGLADADTLQVTTLDVSARVNEHIAEMGRRARAGAPYTIHVALDGEVAWAPEVLSYFGRFGEAVGSPLPVTIPPGLGPLRLRAVAVRPTVVERISARDVNITAQMLPLADAERFDLIVGTNIFLYYDRLQQGLAMASVAAMLRPGGLLLSNNALVEVPSTGMQSIGYSRTLYSNREEDGDLIIWYQKGMK